VRALPDSKRVWSSKTKGLQAAKADAEPFAGGGVWGLTEGRGRIGEPRRALRPTAVKSPAMMPACAGRYSGCRGCRFRADHGPPGQPGKCQNAARELTGY